MTYWVCVVVFSFVDASVFSQRHDLSCAFFFLFICFSWINVFVYIVDIIYFVGWCGAGWMYRISCRLGIALLFFVLSINYKTMFLAVSRECVFRRNYLSSCRQATSTFARFGCRAFFSAHCRQELLLMVFHSNFNLSQCILLFIILLRLLERFVYSNYAHAAVVISLWHSILSQKYL